MLPIESPRAMSFTWSEVGEIESRPWLINSVGTTISAFHEPAASDKREFNS